ncbi:MAG: hypothetical protein J1F11_05110 [Oscillospiraceae bacterium]|nr:hypothetical protein [Oscillospiraceae bacterium]
MTSFMSLTELDIAAAENVRLVRYYTLPDGTAGLLMIYGNKSFVNLCEYDDGWMTLTQKADSLYTEHPDICADGHTRDILEARKNTRCSERFEFLTGTAPYTEKILNYDAKGFYEGFAGYILKEIYSSMEAEFSLIEARGYRESFSLRCKADGREKALTCGIASSGNEYTYSFGNLFEPVHSAIVRIRYNFGSITVTTDIRTERSMQHRYCYDFSESTLDRKIFEGTQMIFSEEKSFDLPAAEMSRELVSVCGAGGHRYSGYTLPWGENVFYRKSESDGEFIAENKNRRVIQIYQKYPHDNVTDEVRVTHEIFERDGSFLIQSELDDRRMGRGTEKALNGYFYRYAGISGIVGIGEDLSGMTGAQLLEKYLHRKGEITGGKK